MQLTLQQLFGEGATQSLSHLVIQKSSLLGLSANDFNRPEQLLAAIINTAKQNFQGNVTTPQGFLLISPQGKNITFNNSEAYDLLNIFQWETTFSKSNKVTQTFIIEEFEIYAD